MKNLGAVSLFCAGAIGCAAAPPSLTQPYGGRAQAIPGVVEAEHFDEGPHDVAYHDKDEKNQGEPYRATRADIEKRSDASGGYGIGWTKAGEWLVYTVDVAVAGVYTIEIPVASKGKGGTFHLEFGGENKSGPIDVPDTGGWQVLKTLKVTGVKLAAGRQMLKLVLDTEGASKSVADIDCMKFTR